MEELAVLPSFRSQKGAACSPAQLMAHLWSSTFGANFPVTEIDVKLITLNGTIDRKSVV